MEKSENVKLKINKKIDKNTFEIVYEKKIYQLTINKLTDEIQFILSVENYFEDYRKTFSFSEIQKTQCFRLEENLDELYNSLFHYIIEDKIKIFQKTNVYVIIFETEFNGKNIKSEITLDKNLMNEVETIKILESNINYLIKENKIKDEKIDFLIKETKENNQKINDLAIEIVKLKDYFEIAKEGEKKSVSIKKGNIKEEDSFLEIFNENNELNENEKKIQEKKIKQENIVNGYLNNLSDLELKYLRYPIIKNYESRILSNAENEKLLFTEWFKMEFSMDLLYSSDIHGKDVYNFHQRCDGENNTLTLILTDNGRRFGGFSYLKFSSENKYEKGNGNDFIFSLDKKTVFKNNKNQIYSLYNNPEVFPSFGYPSDIFIGKSCFTCKNTSFSKFPSSYGVGAQLDMPGDTYLAGSSNFLVKMIEVFKIKFV